MASGYFPLSKDDPEAEPLLEAVKRIKAVRAEFSDLAASGSTPEDAMHDGGYLERLAIAVEFIETCIKT